MELLGHKIEAIEKVEGYRIWLRYRSGDLIEVNLIDLADEAHRFEDGPITAFTDSLFFGQAFVTPRGGLEWPNGFDYCPDALWLRGKLLEIAPREDNA